MEPVGTTSVVDAAAPLYSHAALAQVGATIKHMLETYEAQGVGAVNPLLASIVLEIRARLIQLAAGLDFLGMPTDIVPIWSFEFLQSVARYFAQQAVHAEREFIGFTDRGENEEFSRQQLEQQVALAGAEKELAKQQRMAAEAEQKAYDEAETLAETRALNAQANRNDYAAMSTERIALETSNAWYSAQNPWELDNTIEGEGPDAGRHVHEVIAENTKKRGRIVREYELAAMDRQTAEMQQAEVVAAAQAAAADARVSAAKQMEDVAKLREDAAKDNLEAFDTQFFTPDVWFQMAQFMRNISASYMYKAVRTARLMQRAYNFENDLDRKFIRVDYTTNTIKGLFGADALLLDIDTFTYDLITTVRRKEIPLKQTISVADRYPFLFETEFRKTGRLTFETRLEDFDVSYPGSYATADREHRGRSGRRAAAEGRPRVAGQQRNQPLPHASESIEVPAADQRNASALGIPHQRRRDRVPRGSTAAEDLRRRGYGRHVGARAASVGQRSRLSQHHGHPTDDVLQGPVRCGARGVGQNADGDVCRRDCCVTDASAPLGLPRRVLPLPGHGPARVHSHAARFSLQPSRSDHHEPGAAGARRPRRLAGGVARALRRTVAFGHHRVAAERAGEIVAAGGPWAPLAAGSALGDYGFEARAPENPGLPLAQIRNVVLILEYQFTPRT